MKSQHNLGMENERLRVRLRDIAELAIPDDELLSQTRVNPVVRGHELGVISAS